MKLKKKLGLFILICLTAFVFYTNIYFIHQITKYLANKTNIYKRYIKKH